MTGNKKNKNGIDEFSRFLIWSGIILIIICAFCKAYFMLLFGLIIAGFGIYRCFSVDSVSGSKQNREYLYRRNKLCDRISEISSDFSDRVANLLAKFRRSSSEDNTGLKCFKVFKCPNCRQKLRVPCGKGRIQIHCSRCGNYFIKKS